MKKPKLLDRSELPDSSRKLELVESSEVSLELTTVVSSSKGINRSEISGPATRLLGFMRVTEDMRSRIDSRVDWLLGEKQLVEQGGLLMVPSQGH